jgi:hypothetical protein
MRVFSDVVVAAACSLVAACRSPVAALYSLCFCIVLLVGVHVVFFFLTYFLSFILSIFLSIYFPVVAVVRCLLLTWNRQLHTGCSAVTCQEGNNPIAPNLVNHTPKWPQKPDPVQVLHSMGFFYI